MGHSDAWLTELQHSGVERPSFSTEPTRGCRYCDILFDDKCAEYAADESADDKAKKPFVKVLRVNVTSNEQSLNLETDESYALGIDAPYSIVQVETNFQCNAPSKRIWEWQQCIAAAFPSHFPRY